MRTASVLSGAVLAALVVLPMAPAVADEPRTRIDVLKQVDGEYVVETVTVPAVTAEATADQLEATPEVVAASPSVTYQVEAGYDPFWDTTDPQATSAVKDVWSRTRGEGQIVAVLDTASAIDHPDLVGAALPGIDLATGAEDPWHGYGVAGIVAARADNGIGSAGMAPGARILPVRVCGSSGCESASVARGVLWAADRGADVINMSLAGAGFSDVTAAAIRYALDKNISVVASSGNDGLNGNPVMYPAADSGVIAVSSTDPSGTPSDWAVHGWQVDVSTVGDSVTLTYPGGGYASGSGTSFSGPAVAGAVALLRAAHPGIGTEDVQAALQAGAENGDWNRAYGAGRLVVPAAMEAADRASMDVVVTPGPQQIGVSWPTVPGATQYTVRVDGAVRAVVTGTTTTIAGLTDGNQVAVDVQPDDGPRSRPVLASVGAPVTGTPVLHSVSLRGTASSAVLDLAATVPGSGTGRISILRDGISIGQIAFPFGTATTKSIGLGAMPTLETRWAVRAVYDYGRSSAVSNVLSTGSGRPAPPSAVTGLAGQLDGDQVRLTWDDLGTAYSYQLSVDGTTVARPATAGAIASAPPPGAAHTYSVSAVDAWGQTGPAASTRLAGPVVLPGAPVIGAATPGDASATVRWTAPTVDGGSPVLGYTVRAYRDDALVQTVSAPGDAASRTVTGLTNGQQHTFTVTARNSAGEGAASAVSAPVTPVAADRAGPPSAPLVGPPTALSTAVRLSWAAPADDGGASIAMYRVSAYRGTTLVTSLDVDGSTTTATVTGLANGTAYRFDVTAHNAAGSSPSSTPVTATPRTTPGAPEIASITARSKTVDIRWAKPASTGGAPVTGYVVRAYAGRTLVRSVSAGGSATAVTVTGLSNGTAYRIAVTAVNAAGSGPASATVTATPRTTPGAPRITSVTAQVKAVAVRWARPASTGGAPVTGYVVRAYSGGTVVKTVNASASATSVTVPGLASNTRYTFRVVAKNVAGLGAPSATSPVVRTR